MLELEVDEQQLRALNIDSVTWVRTRAELGSAGVICDSFRSDSILRAAQLSGKERFGKPTMVPSSVTTQTRVHRIPILICRW